MSDIEACLTTGQFLYLKAKLLSFPYTGYTSMNQI